MLCHRGWDYAQQYAAAIEADPTALADTSVFTSHGYTAAPTTPLGGWSKPAWETEWSTFESWDPAWDDGTDASGLTWAQHIHQGLTGAPATAGASTVTVTATDGTGASGSATFTWTISGTGGGTCKVTYATQSQWGGGFVAGVTIANTGSPVINGWTLKFTFPGDQKITNAWNGTVAQSGENVTITNASYNGTITPGGNASLGFQDTWTNSDAAPTAFTVNGAACTT